MQSFLPVPYFASERSFAQFRLPEEARAVIGFGQQPNTLLVITANGTFCTASFDPDKGGTCERGAHHKFIDLDGPEARSKVPARTV